MAQTITQIYSNILTSASNYPNLNKFQSTSATAVKNLIFYVCAIAINALQLLFDSLTLDLQTIRASASVYTTAWWVYIFKEFYQYNTDPNKGVVQISNTFSVYYNTVDPSSRIAKFCAVVPDGKGNLGIKLAKDDGSGNPTEFSVDELNSSISFASRLQCAGLLVNLTSFPADSLQLICDIYIDAQYSTAEMLTNIQNAIIVYLQNINFNGSVLNSGIETTVLNIQGVLDYNLNQSLSKTVNTTYLPYTRIYQTQAGYIQLDLVNSVFNLIPQ